MGIMSISHIRIVGMLQNEGDSLWPLDLRPASCDLQMDCDWTIWPFSRVSSTEFLYKLFQVLLTLIVLFAQS